MKKNAKHKVCENKRYMRQTGGGGPPPDLTKTEQEIVDMIGKTSTDGNNVPESTINFTFNEV